VSLLENKVALITGAGTGIGRAIALSYAREGARLALVGRRKQVLEAVAKEAGGSPLILSGDVSRQGDIDRVLSATVSQLGTLNVLVNNAGILHIGTAEQITEAQWDETFNINVRGLWLLSRSVLPYMRKAGGGSIVNVASVLGINAARNRAAYAASKGAVILLTKSMAIDYGAENIRVNAICPSFVETDLTAEVLRKAAIPQRFGGSASQCIPSVAWGNLRTLPGLRSTWPATSRHGSRARLCLWMADTSPFSTMFYGELIA
jgi:NAD(P)-dependent dehydrogenase (short-subunit alcohol dehydrogenase family)